jgi:5-methylcytosine-specific restriction enzyme subunit McrC
LQFSQHIAKNRVHKERFSTSHQTYEYDNIYNQILKKAIIILEKVVSNFELQKRANKLLIHFEDISNVSISASTFEDFIFGRKRDYYQNGIQLARLIILNYAPNLSTGNEHILAILFDMNRLFEEYILVKLSEVEYEYPNIQVQGQASKKFWKDKTIRPDVILTNELDDTPESTLVIDTKWKIVDSGYPSDNDLKQMYAYNLHFGALKSVLLYPKVDQKNLNSSYRHSVGVAKSFEQHQCDMYFVDLFDGEILNDEIGIEIIRELTDWIGLE